MDLYVYTDETIYEETRNGQTVELVGAGTFISLNPISQSVISEAMTNLQNDPDINEKGTSEMDLRTISSGFFHASMDSKNAHSHLCRSICKYISGNFNYSVMEKKKGFFLTENTTLEKIYRLATNFSALQLFNEGQHVTKIHWYIEGRESFSQTATEEWIENWFNSHADLFSFHLTSIPQFYPEIEFHVENKTTPGLQVLDFMMWATNRKYSNINKPIWFNRLKINPIKLDFNPTHTHKSGNFSLKNEIDFKYKNPYHIDARFLGEIDSIDAIYHLYSFLEIRLKDIYKNGLPPQCLYLAPQLKKVVAKTTNMNNNITSKDIIIQASLYIRLFDTMPLYKGLKLDNDKDMSQEWRNLLFAKKLAGFVIKNEPIHFPKKTDIKDIILKWRKIIIEHNPQHLDVRYTPKLGPLVKFAKKA